MAKMRSLFLVMCGFFSFIWTMMAIAAIPIPRGWYVDGGSGVTRADADYGEETSVNANTGQRWNVNAGYKLMPYFAFEGGYTRYTNSIIRLLDSFEVAKVSHYSCDLTAKGIMPLSDTGFELFAKLGAAYIYSNLQLRAPDLVAGFADDVDSGSSSMVGLYIGGGASYWIIPNMSVYAQFARAKGNDTIGNLDMYTGGISYLFG